MNWLVFHVLSGQAFFTGVALIVVAALASRQSKPIARRITALAFLIGVIAITISSTAIPYWYYAVALFVTIAWFASHYVKTWRRWSAFAVVAVWLMAAVLEIPFHITPTLTPARSRSITIIGDSLTAGIDETDNAKRWPQILARQHNLLVQEIAHAGATTASALKRVKTQPITSPVVLLEIGGNDLLGSTSSAQFARDLDALLTHICTPGRQVIMFELPLPPFHNEYGRMQRTLAKKHNVSLVPKLVLLLVLAEGDATLDTIHLSESGHKRMAACVGRIVRSAFPVTPPE
jgi:acyl-CoA thioesterase-1